MVNIGEEIFRSQFENEMEKNIYKNTNNMIKLDTISLAPLTIAQI